MITHNITIVSTYRFRSQCVHSTGIGPHGFAVIGSFGIHRARRWQINHLLLVEGRGGRVRLEPRVGRAVGRGTTGGLAVGRPRHHPFVVEATCDDSVGDSNNSVTNRMGRAFVPHGTWNDSVGVEDGRCRCAPTPPAPPAPARAPPPPPPPPPPPATRSPRVGPGRVGRVGRSVVRGSVE